MSQIVDVAINEQQEKLNTIKESQWFQDHQKIEYQLILVPHRVGNCKSVGAVAQELYVGSYQARLERFKSRLSRATATLPANFNE